MYENICGRISWENKTWYNVGVILGDVSPPTHAVSKLLHTHTLVCVMHEGKVELHNRHNRKVCWQTSKQQSAGKRSCCRVTVRAPWFSLNTSRPSPRNKIPLFKSAQTDSSLFFQCDTITVAQYRRRYWDLCTRVWVNWFHKVLFLLYKQIYKKNKTNTGIKQSKQ